MIVSVISQHDTRSLKNKKKGHISSSKHEEGHDEKSLQFDVFFCFFTIIPRNLFGCVARYKRELARLQ